MTVRQVTIGTVAADTNGLQGPARPYIYTARSLWHSAVEAKPDREWPIPKPAKPRSQASELSVINHSSSRSKNDWLSVGIRTRITLSVAAAWQSARHAASNVHSSLPSHAQIHTENICVPPVLGGGLHLCTCHKLDRPVRVGCYFGLPQVTLCARLPSRQARAFSECPVSSLGLSARSSRGVLCPRVGRAFC